EPGVSESVAPPRTSATVSVMVLHTVEGLQMSPHRQITSPITLQTVPITLVTYWTAVWALVWAFLVKLFGCPDGALACTVTLGAVIWEPDPVSALSAIVFVLSAIEFSCPVNPVVVLMALLVVMALLVWAVIFTAPVAVTVVFAPSWASTVLTRSAIE